MRDKRLFAGVFPCGISFCDRTREKDGDYLKVAFLPFSTSRLEWCGKCDEEMRASILAHVAAINPVKGQRFPVSTSGQCAVWGEKS
jgi:hypothetical protein